MKTKRILYLLSLSLFTTGVYAQEDAEGCKDHQFFTRMPNFYISECTANYNAVDLQTGAGDKKESVEGNITTIVYTFNTESGQKMPSGLQIVKNYENAIKANGGSKIYSGLDEIGGGPMTGTYKMGKDGKTYKVIVRNMYEPQISGEVGAYTLYVIEMEGMVQDVSAKEMFEKINANGSVALYINFETGKSQIKSESQTVVDQVYEMLKSNASLKVSIEGHTDNEGNPNANQVLSENRAKALMNALVAKGIDKTRMVAKGYGQNKPLADNGSEEGKAKNRRVEIVKM